MTGPMLTLKTSTYGVVQLSRAELGGFSVESLEQLPWARASVARIKRTRFGADLNIGPFVGTLSIPGVANIEIDELVPGTAAACIRLAARGWRTEAQESADSSRIVPAAGEVAAQFVELASRILRAGPRKMYQTRIATLQFPRGHILLSPTLNHTARGHRGAAVCRYRALTSNTPENRVILGAARRAELLLTRELDSASVISARRIQRQLAHVSEWSPKDIELFLRDARSDEQLSLAHLSTILLRGIPVLPSSDDPLHSFSSWINLDSVFEQAMRSVIGELGCRYEVKQGSTMRKLVLRPRTHDGAGTKKRADPDIVVLANDSIIVVDAKYRRSGSRISEDSLYQLIAHADAFEADGGALIVPNVCDEPGVYPLGVDPNGRFIDVIVVDPSDIVLTRGVLQSWLDDVLP